MATPEGASSIWAGLHQPNAVTISSSPLPFTPCSSAFDASEGRRCQRVEQRNSPAQSTTVDGAVSNTLSAASCCHDGRQRLLWQDDVGRQSTTSHRLKQTSATQFRETGAGTSCFDARLAERADRRLLDKLRSPSHFAKWTKQPREQMGRMPPACRTYWLAAWTTRRSGLGYSPSSALPMS